jgi:AcrR family transcriptional regulator
VTTTRRANRGPSAAAENRAALIAAAREVFAGAGADAPLSLIARRAAVGQGSLYRHFPDRASLALAVFEDNVTDLEALAAEPESTLDDILAEMVEQLTESVGFIGMIDPAPGDPRLLAMRQRLQQIFADKLGRPANTARSDVSAEDLMLALSMLAALLSRTDKEARAATAQRAWALLRTGLGALNA